MLDAARAFGSHRALAAVVNAGALVFVSYSLADSTWRFAQPTRPAARASGIVTPRVDFDSRRLQAASLFGTYASNASQRGQAVEESLPRATLNLVLTGIAMLGQRSFALISGQGKPETAYGVGEQIMPGVVLDAVEPDRAVIVRGGVRESLPFKELGAGLPSKTAPVGASALTTGPGGAVLDRQSVKRLLQRPDFLSQALIVPNAGGGFRVGQVQAGSLYERLGLRVGDVIRSVNGQPINNMEEVMRLYQQFGSATEVNVEVLRSGTPQTLHVTLR
jgi:general secretion pathway protein C